ncbi:NF-kappa-B-repressing factor-like [Anthonomus grandis grandis]|uniref:NF-kappa-B-repressing factor-like n=1 Tax=Anthonomus grandis grandis TaxID=2921223 RepID=UPI002166944C|nr:NF-kappa-B-repressing factor-like [Anthonomus grandis grandis]
MDYNNRYGRKATHDQHFRRGSRQNPYDRGPARDWHERPYDRDSYNRGPHTNFPGRYQSRGFNNRNAQGGRTPEQSYYNERFNSHRGYEQRNIRERTFDQRGREVSNSYQRQPEQKQQLHTESHLSPLEEKAKSFLQSVLNQDGVRSKLIFLETIQNPLATLQGTIDYCQLQMTVEPNQKGEFVLTINKEELARGTFESKQIAKNVLAEEALEVLRKDCFYIIKKKEFEEVSTKLKETEAEAKPSTSLEGSKAHQMMLKMGWGGKGLGVNEQGEQKTVAETIDQNVSRQGLGTDDVFKKIYKLLEDYSKSDKMTLLKFDPDFTSEERAHIHKIAQKFGLKSKSEGKGEQRRITVTKKLHRGDLVYNLLINGLENSLYKLEIPEKFRSLWQGEPVSALGEDDDDEDDFQPHFLS